VQVGRAAPAFPDSADAGVQAGSHSRTRSALSASSQGVVVRGREPPVNRQRSPHGVADTPALRQSPSRPARSPSPRRLPPRPRGGHQADHPKKWTRNLTTEVLAPQPGEVAGLDVTPTGKSFAYTAKNYATGETTLTRSTRRPERHNVLRPGSSRRRTLPPRPRHGIRDQALCRQDLQGEPHGPGEHGRLAGGPAIRRGGRGYLYAGSLAPMKPETGELVGSGSVVQLRR